MKWIVVTLVFLLLGFTPPPSHTLRIEISGLKNNKGQVIVDVFSSRRGYPLETEYAIGRKKISIVNDNAVISFELPPGEYAFAIIHDENMNHILDQNILGMPKEGVAASNNAEGFMGPPSYEKAKFKLDKTMSTQISMLYL
ncbi:MAG: DUF2141 domain-containing protein [Cytophagaceae bacterium]|jgi:uncharacterized protein (DUF2141 family)|nr:DUF2141 domain-containing protein [Cytophagaceae bacterium]